MKQAAPSLRILNRPAIAQYATGQVLNAADKTIGEDVVNLILARAKKFAINCICRQGFSVDQASMAPERCAMPRLRCGSSRQCLRQVSSDRWKRRRHVSALGFDGAWDALESTL